MTEQSTGWRDISTAPKDGTYILLAAHDIHGHQDPTGPRQIVRGAYWIELEDTREGGSWSGGAFTTHYPPTHWQPLPPPPGEEAETRADTAAINSLTHEIEQRRDEMQALQARCDKLEAALSDILPVYIEMVEECGHDPSVGIDCSQDFDRIERAQQALRSALDGGE